MGAPQYGTSDLQQPMLQRALIISLAKKRELKLKLPILQTGYQIEEESYA
nr:hypothetical protein [Orientia tsutsugamushi]